MIAASLIFKILPAKLWTQAKADGVFRGAPIDIADGYIHFSTAKQVAETAAKHFAGQTDLVLLAVNSDDVKDELKWEPSRGGALFPHLYGDLPPSAVRWIKPLPWRDGQHVIPELA